LPPRLAELLQPAGELGALVEGLALQVAQAALHGEADAAVRPAEIHVHALAVGHQVFPEVEAQLALGGELFEQEGGAGDAAVEHLLGAAVGVEGDGIALVEQGEAEQKAGLAAADQRNLAHDWVLGCGSVGRRQGLPAVGVRAQELQVQATRVKRQPFRPFTTGFRTSRRSSGLGRGPARPPAPAPTGTSGSGRWRPSSARSTSGDTM
jgi:hypothetical protein